DRNEIKGCLGATSVTYHAHIYLLRPARVLHPTVSNHAASRRTCPDPMPNIRLPLLGSNRGSHLYEALSYVWGPSKTPRVVYIDDTCLAVTENLYMALLRLRNHFLPRIIWADAICIDQSNVIERSNQVQMMVEIYANASRVIIWLEETTASGHTCRDGADVGDSALEAICVAANASYSQPQKPVHPDEEVRTWREDTLLPSAHYDYRQPVSYYRPPPQEAAMPGREMEQRHKVVLPELCTNERIRQRILVLLQRLWFRRVWVLQEVAAARHVSIITRSKDIDGSAFCAGLEALNLVPEDPNLKSRIRSAAYLVRGAIFRNRLLGSRTAQFSLGIRPLVELVDMYHDRNATDPRDKVYALLGMCSDEQIPDGLRPNYRIANWWASRPPWRPGTERRWHLYSARVLLLDSWEDHQYVNVDIRNNSGPLPARYMCRWYPTRSLHVSMVHIQKGDVVCLLQGASTPSIVRLHRDYCSLVAIAVTLSEQWVKDGSQHPTSPLRDLLLIWDWEARQTTFDQASGSEYFEDNKICTHTADETQSHTVSGLETVGFILYDIKKEKAAVNRLERALDVLVRVQGRESLHAVTAMNNLAMAYVAEGDFGNWKYDQKLDVEAEILGRKGKCICTSEDALAALVASFNKEPIGLLLDYRGQEVVITKSVVEAAARNKNSCLSIMTLLLDRREDQVTITEEVVKAAAANAAHGLKFMKLLFNRKENQVTVTEEVVRAAAMNEYGGVGIMRLLLDRRGDQVIITQEVVEALVVHADQPLDALMLLIDRRGGQVTVTDSLVLAIEKDQIWGKDLRNLLLERRGDIRIESDE
ncbi:hypothetical protein PG988_012393, partial [Apiospora saccharicola]